MKGETERMPIRLYDLAAADAERRFSPYCWRARMALAHKGLEVETIPWRFSDKAAIGFTGQDKVPVIVDADRWVADSWAIALYLDEAYPDRTPLFENEAARSQTLFTKLWCEQTLHPAILRIVIMDLFAILHDRDKEYFRRSREDRFGTKLEALVENQTANIAALHKVLEPLRGTLAAHAFLGGATPSYADYIIFAAFQWARVVSPIRIVEQDDPVHAWRDRMLSLFDGLALKAPGHPV